MGWDGIGWAALVFRSRRLTQRGGENFISLKWLIYARPRFPRLRLFSGLPSSHVRIRRDVCVLIQGLHSSPGRMPPRFLWPQFRIGNKYTPCSCCCFLSRPTTTLSSRRSPLFPTEGEWALFAAVASVRRRRARRSSEREREIERE